MWRWGKQIANSQQPNTSHTSHKIAINYIGVELLGYLATISSRSTIRQKYLH
ncbi:MAG: hypothetical protein QNJ54_02225 [Prochloraceae cyanobacterium]|nr:hypothetical protein [Prochloraceae cyanobacterium]